MILSLYSKVLKKIRFSAVRTSFIHKSSKVESGCNLVSVNMGRYSFCGYDCEIINTEIGTFCSIANNVIIGGAAHPIQWVSTSPVFYRGRDSIKKKFSEFERDEDKRTFIGHDVWIGNYTLIKQGVHVGTGAVVGMGSVVTKDVPPYAIVAGNPAKIIRYRFDEETIKGLLDSKWWDMTDDELHRHSQYIQCPELFLKSISK